MSRAGRGSTIPPLPTLWPGELASPLRSGERCFPLDRPELETTYLGRNAVWRCVRVLGLSGQEVVVPAYHHGVEVAALVEAGAIPRFARLDRSLQLDLEHVEELIGPRTRALYLIHYAGFPQPVDALKEIARRRNLWLIEDCALALFSSEGSRPLGSVGDAAIFCFYKTVPVPHGGALLHHQRLAPPGQQAPPLLSTLSLLTGSMLLSAERRYPRAGRSLRQGLRQLTRTVRARARSGQVPVGTQLFDRSAVRLGMSRWARLVLNAADAREIIRRRRANWEQLHRAVGAPERTLWQALPEGVCPLFYPLRVKDKDRALALLREAGIEAVDFWRWGHPDPAARRFPEIEALRREVVELPCHQDLDAEAIDRVAQAARAVL